MTSTYEKEMDSHPTADQQPERTGYLNNTLPQLDSRVEKDSGDDHNASKSSIASPKEGIAAEQAAAVPSKPDDIPPAAKELENSKLKTGLIMLALCVGLLLAFRDWAMTNSML
jgi:hypothetical protein